MAALSFAAMLNSDCSTSAAPCPGAPLIEKLRAIETAKEPAEIDGFMVYPFAASCVLVIVGLLSEVKASAMLREPVTNLVRDSVAALAGDEAADNMVRAGFRKA
jgi:hypothetical protein